MVIYPQKRCVPADSQKQFYINYVSMDVINILVCEVLNSMEYEIELSMYSTGAEIINALVEEGVAPRESSNGNTYQYSLIHQLTNNRLSLNKTLHDFGVRDGDRLFLIPLMEAGARPTILIVHSGKNERLHEATNS